LAGFGCFVNHPTIILLSANFLVSLFTDKIMGFTENRQLSAYQPLAGCFSRNSFDVSNQKNHFI
jgi:hypothetical protein